MLYRFLEPDELLELWDEYCEDISPEGIWTSISKTNIGRRADIYYKYTIRRPVPEPRSVDELPNGELRHIWGGMPINFDAEMVRTMFVKLDELRSRPRETEKEKWIREYMEECAIDESMDSGAIHEYLSKTWDAAIVSTGKDIRRLPEANNEAP